MFLFFHEVVLISDSSLMIRCQGQSLADLSVTVLNLFSHLQTLTKDLGITNLHPAYSSILIDFDPSTQDGVQLKRRLEWEIQSPPRTLPKKLKAEKQIPVHYGNEAGPDISEVAQLAGLTEEEVIQIHSSGEYVVSFLGFSPGFPYLLGLPQQLVVPRKTTPRTRIPAGSVAIAKDQAGIYPSESPAGWQIIGRTEVALFDPRRSRASLLEPGDRVKFVAVEKDQSLPKMHGRSETHVLSSAVALLRVESAGLQTTVQDSGRLNCAHLGLSVGGAADLLALQVGNRIVGNSPEAAAFEMTAVGGTFVFLRDTWIAVTGAFVSAELDQQKISLWSALPVCAGQRLKISSLNGGLRSYLCVHGGVGVPKVMDSYSTFVAGSWGGFADRVLRDGDIVMSGDQNLRAPSYRRCDPHLAELYNQQRTTLRATRGPQADWFTPEFYRSFFKTILEVTQDVSRLGVRLHSTLNVDVYTVEHQNEEMISEGIANGSVQVPSSGQPLILFCEQQTTGGYPKIATVIRADWYKLGQLQPGDRIRFEETSLENARELLAEQNDFLRSAVWDD